MRIRNFQPKDKDSEAELLRLALEHGSGITVADVNANTGKYLLVVDDDKVEDIRELGTGS